MNRNLVRLLPIAFVALACSNAPDLTSDPKAAPQGGTLTTIVTKDLSLGQPITVGNLSVVPVLSPEITQERPVDDYLTLDQAIKLGVIDISELPEAQVESLRVRNSGTKPILLMGGDLLVGGQQDRVVEHDVVIPPGKSVDVSVFCVEQGRWHGSSKKFDSAGSQVPWKVRGASVASPDQGLVWRRVADYNNSQGADARTTTVMSGLTKARGKGEVGGSLRSFTKALDKEKRAVGAIFVRNGEILAMDLFASPKLFRSSRDSLLLGFLAEEDGSATKGKQIDLEACVAFAKEVVREREAAAPRRGVGLSRSRSERVEMVEYSAAASAGKSDPTLVHGTFKPK